ncbi:hypothetical protein [Enterovibrio nigricans]|uniref:Uncharacterized protein n=1 Tax=Enterovibrio nigricans DSM 22720 TaxID=1121868 RepID=A0A1T4U3J2_9GAMM|nr:hypothetical protein [Enterovibrio nigricans]SKA47101.1 hypothetical protein SAMN02745132_00642 [Enterovibrio nigricans DSM 22720]
MLELITNNPEPNNEHFAEEHIRQYAPAFAADVIRFIIRQSDYDELRASSQKQFKDWWQLAIPGGTPENTYESVYWYLLYLIDARREDELRGNRFVKQRIQECACYLINKGKIPNFAHGIRP